MLSVTQDLSSGAAVDFGEVGQAGVTVLTPVMPSQPAYNIQHSPDGIHWSDYASAFNDGFSVPPPPFLLRYARVNPSASAPAAAGQKLLLTSILSNQPQNGDSYLVGTARTIGGPAQPIILTIPPTLLNPAKGYAVRLYATGFGSGVPGTGALQYEGEMHFQAGIWSWDSFDAIYTSGNLAPTPVALFGNSGPTPSVQIAGTGEPGTIDWRVKAYLDPSP